MNDAAVAELVWTDVKDRLPLWTVERPVWCPQHRFPLVVARLTALDEGVPVVREKHLFVLRACEDATLSRADVAALVTAMDGAPERRAPPPPTAAATAAVAHYLCFVDGSGTTSVFSAAALRSGGV